MVALGVRFGGLVLASVYLLGTVQAHIALWDEAMYGFDPNDPNQQEPVVPLENLPLGDGSNGWWFHSYINKPPAPGKYMNLPAGGTYHGQVACNKALTTYGRVPSQQTGIYACDGDEPDGGIGAMHTADKWRSPVNQLKDVKGCGLAIAYKSDPHALVPEDFTVISTNYTCPWFKKVDFQIPADLPPCPPGGCHCMWGWVHSINAGSNQNYVLNYRCNVTGATGPRAIPAPKPAKRCSGPAATSSACTLGAKQPHYWYQTEGNNWPEVYGENWRYDPPFYNGDHGFANGAQNDLWAGAASAPSPAPPPSPPPSSSTSTTAAASSTGNNGTPTSPSIRPSSLPTLPGNCTPRVRRKRDLDRTMSAPERVRHLKRNERRRQRLLGRPARGHK